MLRAVHVRATWGRHCNWIVFLTSKSDPLLHEVIITPSGDENYDRLWWKVTHGFKMVHSKYLDMADFFVKADDDTYFVLENLKHFIKTKGLMGLKDPLYMGLRLFPLPNYESLKKELPEGFYSGGNGYVLNKAALDLLVRKGLGPSGDCHQLKEHHGEDVAMGHCMTSLGEAFAKRGKCKESYEMLSDGILLRYTNMRGVCVHRCKICGYRRSRWTTPFHPLPSSRVSPLTSPSR